MQRLSQIAYASLVSTSRCPRWWILALPQAAAFYFLSELPRSRFLSLPFLGWLAAAAIVLIPATVWLWLDMDAKNSGRIIQKRLKLFIQSCLTAAGIMLSALAIILFIQLTGGAWVFFALVSSVVAATAALAMLYAVLCGQKFAPALALAVDTWNKKFSLAAAAAFILILGHAVSFAFVHGFWKSSPDWAGFSVFSHSATIWVLLPALMILAAFCVAVLNCFLVFLFLESIRRKKDPESAEEAVAAKQPVFEANP